MWKFQIQCQNVNFSKSQCHNVKILKSQCQNFKLSDCQNFIWPMSKVKMWSIGVLIILYEFCYDFNVFKESLRLCGIRISIADYLPVYSFVLAPVVKRDLLVYLLQLNKCSTAKNVKRIVHHSIGTVRPILNTEKSNFSLIPFTSVGSNIKHIIKHYYQKY